MIETDGAAPYAPAPTVMSVIKRHREVALTQFDLATMQRIGVSDSLAPRVLQTLRLMDLVDEAGKPTATFESLRKAPSDQFRPMLADVVKAAYAAVFAVVDPTIASADQIDDAFRHFKPAGQRSRMVTLFTGLLAEAGLIKQVPPKTRSASTSTRPRLASPQKRVEPETSVTDTPKSPPAVQEQERGVVSPQAAGPGDTYSVTLASGGTLTISMDVNLFRLSVDDRAFVIDLVDRLTGYTPVVQEKGGGSAN